MRAARHRAVLVVLAFLALLGWGASPAAAGGPTSVLLVNVADGRTAASHVSQATYDRLWQAFEGGLGPVVGAGTPSAHDTEVRLTWLVHDVTPWRLDSVVRDGADLWVQTQVDMTGEGSLWDATPSWHHLTGASATSLDGLLGELGVTGPVTGAASSSGGSAADAAPDPRAADTGAAAARSDEVLAGWRLALLAGIVGAGIGLLLGRIGTSRARHEVDARLDPVTP